MPVFDALQRASFSGIDFPVRSVQIRGRYRHHTHEYLRVPGGVNEKLERGLYTIEMAAVFDANVKGYGALWPSKLGQLRALYENGLTAQLTIPTIGTVQAFLTEWDQSADMGKVRSGETVRLPFLEDRTEIFLSRALAGIRKSSVGDASQNLAVTLKNFDVPPEELSVFDAIQEAANSIFAIKDQANLYGGLVGAKIAQLTQLLNEADRTLDFLKDPVNHELLEALHQLWEAVVNLGQNLAESPRGARTYVTPRTMSVSDIAAAVYNGNTERANELMVNNDLADPFAVPAGSTIIWFAD